MLARTRSKRAVQFATLELRKVEKKKAKRSCLVHPTIFPDANTKHRSEMEDAWIMMDQFAGSDGSAFFGLYDVMRVDCLFFISKFRFQGHNGIAAAEFCMAKLHLFCSRNARKQPSVPMVKHLEAAYQLAHEVSFSFVFWLFLV